MILRICNDISTLQPHHTANKVIDARRRCDFLEMLVGFDNSTVFCP